MRYKSEIIDEETFFNEYREGCPSPYGINGKCGLANGFYDCKTCWGIALKNVKEIELVWGVVGINFNKEVSNENNVK